MFVDIVFLLIFESHNQKRNKMKKSITKERITKVILSVLNSPNKSVERAALWARLIKLRSSL